MLKHPQIPLRLTVAWRSVRHLVLLAILRTLTPKYLKSCINPTSATVLRSNRLFGLTRLSASHFDMRLDPSLTLNHCISFPNGKNVTPGIEPIIGQGAPRVASGLDPHDFTKSYSMPDFVVSNGGEYFFIPSISALTDKITA